MLRSDLDQTLYGGCTCLDGCRSMLKWRPLFNCEYNIWDYVYLNYISRVKYKSWHSISCSMKKLPLNSQTKFVIYKLYVALQYGIHATNIFSIFFKHFIHIQNALRSHNKFMNRHVLELGSKFSGLKTKCLYWVVLGLIDDRRVHRNIM